MFDSRNDYFLLKDEGTSKLLPYDCNSGNLSIKKVSITLQNKCQ